jgi:hypothetical protein
MSRTSSTHGGEEEYMQAIGGKARSTSLGKPKRKWEDNIKIDLREIGWGGTDWIHLAQGWGQGSCEHGN